MTMTKKIRLTPGEVENFVNTARKCDFDIDIAYNRYTVDAKSILGVLAMDFRRELTVTYHGYNAEFEQLLKSYARAS